MRAVARLRRAKGPRSRSAWNAAVLENTLFDLLGEPVLVVARDCSLLDLSSAAAALLTRGSVLRVDRGRLAAPSAAATARLRRSVAGIALQAGPAAALTMALPSYDGRAPALAVLSPLQRGEFRVAGRGYGRPDPGHRAGGARRRLGRRAARPVRPDPGRGANRPGAARRSAAAGDRGSASCRPRDRAHPPAPDLREDGNPAPEPARAPVAGVRQPVAERARPRSVGNRSVNDPPQWVGQPGPGPRRATSGGKLRRVRRHSSLPGHARSA